MDQNEPYSFDEVAASNVREKKKNLNLMIATIGHFEDFVIAINFDSVIDNHSDLDFEHHHCCVLLDHHASEIYGPEVHP